MNPNVRARVAAGLFLAVLMLATLPGGPSPVSASAPSARAAPPAAVVAFIPKAHGAPPPIPPGASVNPTAYYSSEPAPMGVTDFGVTPGGVGYVYHTNEFLGTARIVSLSAKDAFGGESVSLQLNVVVVLTSGSREAAYWIQDVPFYNASTHDVQFIDNVWNMSGSAGMNSRSVVGNGSVYNAGSGEYLYEDGAGPGYSGSDVALSLPANISAAVVASDISGTSHVGFEYDDGYGWQIYDNVTFPWTQGWTLRGFEVNGTAYNANGLFNDAEWVLARTPANLHNHVVGT